MFYYIHNVFVLNDCMFNKQCMLCTEQLLFRLKYFFSEYEVLFNNNIGL